MKTLKGKLEFISFWNPIKLITESEELDLRDEYFQVLENLNGKSASIDYHMNNITIHADKNSEYDIKFEKDDLKDTILMILDKRNNFGFSNLNAYIPDMFQRLNGMQVIVTVNDQSIGIEHDETEKVFELKYTHNNSCKVSDDKVKEICKIGKNDCCIFCTAGSNGFMCEKFNSHMASHLLNRFSEGTMRANRIGNCKIVGRI